MKSPIQLICMFLVIHPVWFPTWMQDWNRNRHSILYTFVDPTDWILNCALALSMQSLKYTVCPAHPCMSYPQKHWSCISWFEPHAYVLHPYNFHLLPSWVFKLILNNHPAIVVILSSTINMHSGILRLMCHLIFTILILIGTIRASCRVLKLLLFQFPRKP